ncbi:lytic transglycosylase domain-containing protein [Tahibacter amnicola]|uniref:Lytic transglycosylase domain-containing protein n=1 Tax=Tahibacter amnicola TaxID=2976241 RepID=A0ABY6BDW5_9GAMM|nr:lytic transglycosylase domain-containing protein [Tahibacter amnicola]UXI68223.1 lytic transglycosylase domain-containing protein [Tahibacter amnicola]
MRRESMPKPRRWRALLRLAVVLAAFPAASSLAADLSQQRAAFRRAFDAVEHGRDWKAEAPTLEEYPLLGALQALELARRVDKLKRADLEAFLARWPDAMASEDLRRAWLGIRAERGEWKEFLAVYSDNATRELSCHALSARLADGAKLTYAADIKPLWEGNHALPSACDGPVKWALEHRQLDTARLWQRIEHAAAAGQAGWITPLVALLPAADRPAATRLALALREPAVALKQATSWPNDARHRDAVAHALARLARREAASAHAQFLALQGRFTFSETQKGQVAAALALYQATEFGAEALARLANLPTPAQTDSTREWRVRVALAASDWPAALAGLDALSDTQKADAEWRYLRARVLTKLGRRDEAAPLFAAVAREANFFGFLAADWTEQPYSICALSVESSPDLVQSLRRTGLDRAFEWRAVGRGREARREWDHTLARLEPANRRVAADLAYREGWYDRAVFALNKGEELKLYEQRFPLAREPQIRRESHETGLDPAWTYAIIRAESAWVEDARSHANALGLMQLIPETAARVAKANKLPYSRPEDLFLPDTNIALGTRYLAQMAGKYNGAPWLASAAYNAGPGAVQRWLDARSALEPDFFIASIPYRETREYVARVLAFSVIYDWRMNGSAVALATRLPRYGQAFLPPSKSTARKKVICPAPLEPAAPAVATTRATPGA